jgi:hypothetical protein
VLLERQGDVLVGLGADRGRGEMVPDLVVVATLVELICSA